MREFCRLFIIALSVCSASFPQISDITRLPVQNPSQSIKESAPVWISENEILIFYVSETLDTIYSTRSTDRGFNWDDPNTIQVVEPNSLQDLLYLTSIKTNSGRIILCWLIRGEGAKEIHSDDKGINWSQKKDLNISPFNSLADLNLSLSDSGRLYLCFNLLSSNNQYLYYSISDDDGNTWSEIPEQIFFSSRIKVRDLTIISSNGTTLTGIFQMKVDNTGIFGIYRIVSNDNGVTWSDTINIARSEKNLVSSNLEKDSEGTLWLTYQEEDTIRYSSSQSGYYVTNYICYK